jgi:hypothetical protein
MPTSLSPVGIANVALSKIGAQAINSLLDTTNPSAVACNNNFGLAYLEVSRAARWNCLLTTANLVQEPQTPLPGCTPPTNPATWAPNTTYQANTYLTYGGYYYLVMFTYTSTNNFTNDLTSGALTQTNLPTNQPFVGNWGSQYASGWAFQYALPSDFQLLCSLNDNVYWGFEEFGDGTSDYEIMGSSLFCNEAQAVIQYVKNQPDTTQFDSLMANCLALKLAAMISTYLRQDGGALEAKLTQAYEMALRQARTKNGGEKQARRFNPIASSTFNRARFGGVNG